MIELYVVVVDYDKLPTEYAIAKLTLTNNGYVWEHENILNSIPSMLNWSLVSIQNWINSSPNGTRYNMLFSEEQVELVFKDITR